MSGIRYREFAHIDAIRAGSVLLVVVSHAGLTWIPGGMGVTFFFGVSGFIITYLLIRERERTGSFSLLGFYTRRALKLGPPLLAIVLVPSLIYGLWNPLRLDAIAAQVLFSFNWLAIADPQVYAGILPGSGVTWSLAIEEQFYISFALIWLLFVKRGLRLRWMAVLASVAIVAATVERAWGFARGFSELRIEWGTDTRIDAIAWGILVAVVYSRWSNVVERQKWVLVFGSPMIPFVSVALVLVSLAVRGEAFRAVARMSLQELAVALVVLYGLVAREGFISRWFSRLASIRIVQVVGLASYSIYLLHSPLLYALRAVVPTPTDPLWHILVSVASAIVVVAAGVGAWRLIEVPVESAKRARAQRAAQAGPNHMATAQGSQGEP